MGILDLLFGGHHRNKGGHHGSRGHHGERYSREAYRNDCGNATSDSKLNNGTACSKCNSINPENAKFCLQCGSSLATNCKQCNSPLAVGIKFCGQCGKPAN